MTKKTGGKDTDDEVDGDDFSFNDLKNLLSIDHQVEINWILEEFETQFLEIDEEDTRYSEQIAEELINYFELLLTEEDSSLNEQGIFALDLLLVQFPYIQFSLLNKRSH